MKLTIQRSAALPALIQALQTCNTKDRDSVDSMFLIDTTDGLTITSINEQAQQTVKVPVHLLEDGGQSFLVAGEQIAEFARQFPDDEVSCAYHEEDRVFLMGSQARKSKFAFPVAPASEFVPFEFISDQPTVEMSGNILAQALRNTAFAASQQPTDAPLTAVKITVGEDRLRALASDKARVSLFCAEGTSAGAGLVNCEFLLKAGVAKTLAKLVADENEVTVQAGQGLVRFTWADTVFTARLERSTAKPFPDFTRVFAGEEVATATISRADLLRSVKLAGLLAKDSYVLLKLAAEGLWIITNERDRGMSQDVVVAQDSTGEAETYVALRYFREALEAISSPWVNLLFRVLPTQARSIAVQVTEDGFQHVVFPVTPNDAAQMAEEDADGDSEEE